MSSSTNNMSKFHTKLQVSTSSATKQCKVHKTKKTRVGEAQNLNSLFNEICDILGSENTISAKKQSESALPGTTHPEIVANAVGKTPCTLDACENANEKEIPLSSNNKLTGTLSESDISSIVHKITAIVRDENVAVSMEERLKNACLEYNEEIVEKVLKRCFKVPYLAFRFFNWVRSVKAFRHNTLTYNVMIYMAAEAKDSGLVDALLEEMVKNSCEKNIKTWSIVISHCGNTKSIGKALSIFERMKKHGPKPDLLSYKVMLNALCNAGKADVAFEFYKEMKHEGMFLDERSYKNLLKCLAAFGDIVEAHKIINDMIRTLEVSEHGVYGLMLKSLCVSGRIREALELIREMMNKNVNLESEDFGTLVKGLCKVGRINDALEIVDITKKRNAGNRNLYDIILHEYLRRNEFPKALDLMRKVKDLGHLPSLATYTTLIKHFFRVNESQKAVELYQEMMDRGIGLDCVAMTAVITGYIRQNCISEAFGAFKEMKDKGVKPSKKFYGILVKELIKVSGPNGDILKLLKELEEASKLEPGDDVIQHVISHLKMKGEKNKLNGNREIHLEGNAEPNAAKPEGESSDHHYDACWISRILSSSMDWWFIKEQLEKCSIQFTPEVVTEILHNSKLHAGMALQFFSWVENRTGYRHTTGSYNMAIKIAGQGKDFKQMRSLFYEMRRKGCSITCDTWTIMIMQYGRTGLTHIALQTFRDMKERGYNPTESTFKFLILCLCEKKGRNVNEAVNLFNEMIERGCIPDKELAEAYLGCLCEVGKSNDARSCVESLQKTGFTVPLSYSLYIRSLCRVGRLQEAFELISEVDDDDEQQTLAKYTYGSLIHGLLQRGSIKAAFAKIESMKQIGVHPTVHTYTSLIVYYFKEKQIEKVLGCLEEMKESGCEPTLVTYSALLRGYTNLGKVADAWSVFQHIKQNGPFPDFKTYSIFLSCLCRVGKSEEAFQLITEMMNTGIAPSAVNFKTVFYGLNREGKQSLAKRLLMKKSDLKRMRTLSI